MMETERRLARDALRGLAEAQNGLVTRQQAIDVLGLTAGAVDNLVARGGLQKVAHGIYRFPHLSGAELEQLQVALLRTGDPAAALSHETALALHEISDVNPAIYHVTVPSRRRIRRADSDRYAVHTQALKPAQVTWWNLMRIVTAPTAVEQCLTLGTPTYLVRQALERGARNGSIRTDEVRRLSAELEARQ